MRRTLKILAFLIFLALPLPYVNGQTTESKLCQKPPAFTENQQRNVAESVRQIFRNDKPIRNKEFETQKTLWDKYFFCLSDVSLNILDLTREKIIQRRTETEAERLPALLEAFGLETETSDAKAVAAQVAFLIHKREDAVQLAEKAVIFDPQNFEAHYVLAVVKNDAASADAAIKLNPDFAPAYIFKIESLLNESAKLKDSDQTARYKTILEVSDAMLANSTPPDVDFWREQRDGIAEYLKYTQNNAEIMQKSKDDIVTSVKITSTPRIGYTEDARQAKVSGNIRLMVYFGADGQVKAVFVLKSLPGSLTRQAVKAAKQIKFKPATRNGIPVDGTKIVEYGFNIY